MLSQRNSPKILFVLIFGGGVAWSFLMFFMVRHWERAKWVNEFRLKAAGFTAPLEAALQHQAEVIRSFGESALGGEGPVGTEAFRLYAKNVLAVCPGIELMAWIPRVGEAERPVFERAARAQGLENFHIREVDGSGALTQAGIRREYFPLQYMEPLSKGPSAVGIDAISIPIYQEAMARAREQGVAAATTHVTLNSGEGFRSGRFLVFVPFFRRTSSSGEPDRASLRGYIMGVWNVAKLVERGLKKSQLRGVHVHVFEGDQAFSPLEAWAGEADGNVHPIKGEEESLAAIQRRGHASALLVVAGRPLLAILHPTTDDAAGSGIVRAWGMLMIGLTLTGMLGAYVWSVKDREAMAANMNEALRREMDDRQRAEAQLFQAQKLESVSRLANNIAHELKNSLTVIVGFSDLLKGNNTLDEEAQRDVGEMSVAARKAADLIQRLLVFSRQQAVRLTVLDLVEAWPKLEKTLRLLIRETVTMRVQLAPALGTIKMDVGQLEQLLANLTLNANEAMPQGGELTIHLTHATLTPLDVKQLAGLSPGEHVVIAVSDSGGGMSEEVKARLFEPFFTTKSAGRGSGLGLSTVYGIVKQSGGHLHVSSELGKGATFTLYFPCVPGSAAPAESAVPSPAQAGPEALNETILVVDDEPAVRTLVSRVLRKHGFRTMEAGEGEEALRMIEQSPPRSIDLVLTDIMMPHMSGSELAERLRIQHPAMKVLFTSGYLEESVKHHGVMESGVSFLPKPFTPEILVLKVREVLGHAI